MTTQQPEALPSFEMLAAQSQVFASAWSLVDGPFDAGDGMASAEVERAILLDMARRLHTEIETLRAGYDAARLEIESLKAQLEAVGAGGVAPLMAAPAQAASGAPSDSDALRCAVGNCKFNGEVDQHAQNCAITAAVTAAPAQAGEYPPLPEQDATTVGLGHVWNRHSMRAFADATCAARGAAQAQPVAWALKWPGDDRLNLSTVFDTRVEATDYLLRCDAGVTVLPLYAAPQPPAQAQEDTKRLDYLQRGSTIELLPGVGEFYPMQFRIGGLHMAVNVDVRIAIDAAIAAQQGGARWQQQS